METETRISLDDFIRSAGVSMVSKWAPFNPNMDGSDNMDNWRCIMRAGRSQMTVYFSKGLAHKGAEPTPAEVLDCLASDASGFENARSFEDWATEYGYDTDSRKAERTYRLIERQAAKLRKMLGDSAYKTLLWEIERE